VREFNIWDPYNTVCGRFDCAPADYGITKAEADALLLLNFGRTQEEALTQELNEWYAAPAQSNIPEKDRGCALELAMVADALKLTADQRRFLASFNERWDIAAHNKW
jgi:hypothetical protein